MTRLLYILFYSLRGNQRLDRPEGLYDPAVVHKYELVTCGQPTTGMPEGNYNPVTVHLLFQPLWATNDWKDQKGFTTQLRLYSVTSLTKG